MDRHFGVLMLLTRRSVSAISGVTKWAKDSYLLCSVIQQESLDSAGQETSSILWCKGLEFTSVVSLYCNNHRRGLYLFILKSIPLRIIPDEPSQSEKWETQSPWWAMTESDHCRIQKREGISSPQSHYRLQMNRGTHELCMRQVEKVV